jgi:hypothetical protein
MTDLQRDTIAFFAYEGLPNASELNEPTIKTPTNIRHFSHSEIVYINLAFEEKIKLSYESPYNVAEMRGNSAETENKITKYK